jgi:IS1 family transposase
VEAKAAAEERKEEVISASLERCSLRGLERIFQVPRQRIAAWIGEKAATLPPLSETVSRGGRGSSVQLDEVWTFVGSKDNPVYLWTALNTNTREIIAWHLGDRSATSAKAMWEQIPPSYQQAWFYSDLLASYPTAFPWHHLIQSGKETGLTAYMERWNYTLRQRLGRFVRKTLSFSKSIHHLKQHLSVFIHHYNKTLTASF